MRPTDRNRRARLAPVLAAACLALGSALVAPAGAAEPSFDTGQPTVRAANACFSDNIRVTGWLLPRQETGVAMPLEGYRIAEVLVREGQVVGADQDLVRLARLPDPPGPPNPATARLPAAMTLKAPAAGIVSRIAARVGAVPAPGGDPLVRLVTDPDVDVLVEVPSPHVARIKAGASARVLLDDGTEVPALVRTPAAEVDPTTQFARARLSVRADRPLRFGSFARALVDTGRSCGVAVPRSAILRQNDATSVQVMKDGHVEARRVRVGLSSEDAVEIREGLAEGEVVVTNAGLAF
jgi:HlyD family secretion protein